MKVIGITGGVGCGKSMVLDLIKENFNAYIVKADDVARHVLDKGEEGYYKAIDFFGDDILDENDQINRNRLAEIVFNDSEKLGVLNGIVHPVVKENIKKKMSSIRSCGKFDYFIVEAALLFDDHYESFCDEVWYIYADYDVRVKRLIESRGYSLQKIAGIMGNQMSEEEFREKSDYVIDNSNGIEETLVQLKKKLVEE
ncbi:MAG: dephospho-CoA kinase [Lachnospiraceae bacterium]